MCQKQAYLPLANSAGRPYGQKTNKCPFHKRILRLDHNRKPFCPEGGFGCILQAIINKIIAAQEHWGSLRK